MRIHYKTHYILNQTRRKFVAMKDSAFNVGTFDTLDEAMLACDGNRSTRLVDNS